MPIQKITSGIIADGAIVATDVADGSITNDKIVSVANTKITGNIASSQIAPNQVLYGNVAVGSALTPNNTTTLSVAGDVELQKTVTSDGDSLGKLVFWNNTNAGAASGTSFIKDVAYIKGVMDGTGNNSGGRLEFYTKADGASSVKAMNIDGAGRVTLAYQPSFYAYRSADLTMVSGTNYVVYNTVEFNVGSHYNSSTGTFTAPIAGKYIFFHRVNSNSDAMVETKILKNDVEVSRNYFPSISGISRSMTGVTFLSLAANDYVNPIAYDASGGKTLFGTAPLHSSFWGYLVG
jgi:hypothetical protein